VIHFSPEAFLQIVRGERDAQASEMLGARAKLATLHESERTEREKAALRLLAAERKYAALRAVEESYR
jgi:hypothetical protein